MFKHTKKLISTVLTTALFVSVIPSAAFAEDSAPKKEVVATDDFQSYAVGAATPSGYDGSAKGNTWKIEQTDDGNKYYAMTVDTASDGHLDDEFGKIMEDKFVFQFDMRFRDYGQVEKWLYFINGNATDTFIIDIKPNGTITAHDGTPIGRYALNKFYTIAIEVDPQEGLMSVKFNNKWRLNDHPIGECAPTSWRLHMRTPSGAGTSTIDFDNLIVYTGEYTMDDASDSDEESSNSSSSMDPFALKYDLSAMYVGKDSTLVKGQQVYISQNDEIVPYKNGDVNMVPVKAFIESIGGTASWDDAEKSATFTANGNTLKLFMGTRTCYVNGTEKYLVCPSDVGAGNVFYAPIINLCEYFGQYLHEEDNGLMIYSENNHEAELDWVNNMNFMRNVCESFMFDNVTGAEIAAMIEAKHPNNHHPRLIFTEEKFAKIRAEINDPNGDPIYKKLFSLLTTNCNRFLNEPPSGYEIRDGIRLMDVVEENSERMYNLAIMYNLTGEEKYAKRAYEEMHVSACFVDFNPYHFLDVGQMASALGLCYDWMYNWMDESERRVIREAIIKKGIYPIIEDFDGKPRSRSWNWRGDLADNWCLVISGVAVGAMAVVDEAHDLDRINCERAMEQCLIDMRRALSLFAPYGAYEEGFGYWDYAMRHYTQTMESLKSATGDDFGYQDVVGMSMTADFVSAVNGSISAFSYHDTGESNVDWPSPLMWVAKTFGRPELALPRIEQIQKAGNTPRVISWDFFLYDPIFLQSSAAETQLDVSLPIAEIATMRSGYDSQDMWLGLHCDDPISGEGHDHMDSGVFVLDSQGVNWFYDLGSDSYSLNNYTQAYRVRGEGHNIVIFNPTREYSLKYGGNAYMEDFESAPQGAFAIGNLDDAHRDDIGVISHRRGAKLDDMRRVATIQDEIRLEKPAEMYWFAHTRAEIEVSEDGKTAILSRQGRKLMAKIINGEGAKFTVMDAVSLPSSPKIDNQNLNRGTRKLTIHMPSVQNIDLTVCFVDYNEDTYYDGMYNMEYKPLDEWEIPSGAIADTSVATVTGIYVDGQLIPGFNPNKSDYAMGGNNVDELIGKITATGEGDVIVSRDKDSDSAVTILAKGTGYQRPRIYTIKFIKGGGIGEPVGKDILVPVDIQVSATPQAENKASNLSDGDLTTKWAAEGVNWILYDLGEVKDIDSVGIAFMEGDIRTAQFEILTSEDGVNYKQWFNGDSQFTLNLENHKTPGAKARFVRVVVKGYNNDPGNWNSVMELRVYAA